MKIQTDEQGAWDAQQNKFVSRKMWTLTFQPVMGAYDRKEGKYVPNENTRFWEATPSGEFQFSSINEAAARAFRFDREYYVDFILAPEAVPP